MAILVRCDRCGKEEKPGECNYTPEFITEPQQALILRIEDQNKDLCPVCCLDLIRWFKTSPNK